MIFEHKAVAIQCDGGVFDLDTEALTSLKQLGEDGWEIKGVMEGSSQEGWTHTLLMSRFVGDERWLRLELAMRKGFRLTAHYHKTTDLVDVDLERVTSGRQKLWAACCKSTLAEALVGLHIDMGWLK